MSKGEVSVGPGAFVRDGECPYILPASSGIILSALSLSLPFESNCSMSRARLETPPDDPVEPKEVRLCARCDAGDVERG